MEGASLRLGGWIGGSRRAACGLPPPPPPLPPTCVGVGGRSPSRRFAGEVRSLALVGAQEHGVRYFVQGAIDPRGRDSHHLNPLSGQPDIPCGVALPSVVIPMRSPVYLNGQSRRGAVEIEDDRPKRMLSAECGLVRTTAPKPSPKQHLGIAHRLPQRSRAIGDQGSPHLALPHPHEPPDVARSKQQQRQRTRLFVALLFFTR